jgi:chemotaxis signal transduction protein
MNSFADINSEYLIFNLQGSDFAIPVANLKEIIPYKKETAIPFPQYCQRGIISVREKTLPIFDISPLINKEHAKMANGYFAIVEAKEKSIAIYLDKPERIHSANESEISPLKFKKYKSISTGVLKFEQKNIIIIGIQETVDQLSIETENKKRNQHV